MSIRLSSGTSAPRVMNPRARRQSHVSRRSGSSVDVRAHGEPRGWFVKPSAGRGLLILVVLATVLYVPFLGGGWLTDDFVHLQRLERASIVDIFSSSDAFG